MSGIYAALLTGESHTWTTALERMISAAKIRGRDGTKTAVFRTDESPELLAASTESPFKRKPTGQRGEDVTAFVGCAYSKPISLDPPDRGPFTKGKTALTYDGVITGQTGEQLLASLNPADWSEQVAALDGQFALIAIFEHEPRRIFYAVKAKPLYLLYDSQGRGVVVSSSERDFAGMYHPTRSPQPYQLGPYTCGSIDASGVVALHGTLIRNRGRGTLILSGGGLDSEVTAYEASRRYPEEPIELLYVNYGAKATPGELNATRSLQVELGSTHRSSVSYRSLRFHPLMLSSSLTRESTPISENPIPGIASEWVPARNTLLAAIALSVAESDGFARIALGINQDAATAYPDNDTEWARRFRDLIPLAVGTGRYIELYTPLAELSKVEIVKHGAQLHIPWARTRSWSCYEGGVLHCGKCSSCRARRKAFKQARIADVTEYAG